MSQAPFGSCRTPLRNFLLLPFRAIARTHSPHHGDLFLALGGRVPRGVLATYSREQGAAGFPGSPLCIVSGLR